ncbi:MAG: transposase [Phycisphaerae bacterium]
MKLRHYIAMDVHCSHTTLEAQTRGGRVIRRLDLPTEPGPLINAVKEIPGPRGVVIEESTMADWGYRLLRPFANEVIVCDPRRNRLVSDGDKDDSVDPGKLAELYRLNALRSVHHPQRRSMMDQRRWVWLYLDQVELAVASKNKIKAAYRFHGVRYGQEDVYDKEARRLWLERLPSRGARQQMELRYRNLDQVEAERYRLGARLERIAARHPVVKTFLEIPGYGPVYGMTFWVIVDSPWRFKTVRKLWTYAGLGLQRNKSGMPKAGKPHSNGPLHLNAQCNRRLKNVAKGVAMSALARGDNAFARVYERLVAQGISPSNARLTVVRKALAVPWAMRKRGERYRSDLI